MEFRAQKVIWFAVSISSLFLGACNKSTPEVMATDTPDLRTPMALTARAATATQDAAHAHETQAFEQTAAAGATSTAQSEKDQQATAASEATKMAIIEQTLDAGDKTQEAIDRQATSTAKALKSQASATAQAEPMLARVQELFDDGYLDTNEGTYQVLEDFDESWAQIDWYQWWRTGYDPANFVIRVDAFWQSASDKANWWNSGCGFVFREFGGSYYFAELSLDGYVYLYRKINQNYSRLGRSYYGSLDVPEGSAELMLVANGDWLLIFVNGELVHRRQDSRLDKGMLSMTLSSGTNKGYGTRCKMENVDLWVLP